mgnify:CR=1 FL=1
MIQDSQEPARNRNNKQDNQQTDKLSKKQDNQEPNKQETDSKISNSLPCENKHAAQNNKEGTNTSPHKNLCFSQTNNNKNKNNNNNNNNNKQQQQQQTL